MLFKLLTALEKKFADEKKQRTDFQLKLEAERKNKKVKLSNYQRQNCLMNPLITSNYYLMFIGVCIFN